MCARREAVKALLQLGLAVELCWHCYCIDVFYFFFSSIRRHTRSLCDWISDVCSSDLAAWRWLTQERIGDPCRRISRPLIRCTSHAKIARLGGFLGLKKGRRQQTGIAPRRPLLGWSGRAPAPPVSEPCQGRQSQGARYVSATQHDDPVIGVDIGKNSFHVVGLDQRGAIVLRQKWSRGQVESRFANMPPCLIGMEACVGAHHLSRQLKGLGHDARLMPAKYVRPYSKGQKNDFRDAEAIAEAVQRPTMKFVATKTADQLDLQALHRLRERLVSQRTGIINQIRAFLLERGVAVRQGLRFLRNELPSILGAPSDALSPRMVRILEDLAGDWRRLDERVEGLSKEIEV